MQRVINGRTYDVSPLPAMRAVRVQAVLARVLGPLAPGLVGGGSGIGSLDVSQLAEALGRVAAQAREDDVVAIVDGLLPSGVICDGRPVPREAFDAHFIGKTLELWRVVALAVEVNYADFFEGARALAAKLGGAGEHPPSP